MAQDFYDSLQVFNYLADRLDNNKNALGIKYVARQEDNLLSEYPAALISMERPMERLQHATRQFLVTFNVDFWVFHAELTKSKQLRSIEDIEMATNVRKFLHSDFELGGHIIFGFIDGEFPGVTTRMSGAKTSAVITTRLTWSGENRVPYAES